MRLLTASALSMLVLGAGPAGAAPPDADGLFFAERFDDAGLLDRGWYDGGPFRIIAGATDSDGCIEYEWSERGAAVRGSTAVRHLFEPTEEVHLRFRLRLSKDWGWSGKGFHPHLLNVLTTENDRYAGPAATHLTLYVEPCDGRLRLAAQDIQNKEMPRGLTQGPLKGGYNGTFYDSREVLFTDDSWHLIEAQFKLNSVDVATGRANRDGIARGWFDGKLVVDRTDVILRSGDFPAMKFNQFLMAPYFGPGLVPHAQSLWIDDVAVGSRRLKAPAPADGRADRN